MCRQFPSLSKVNTSLLHNKYILPHSICPRELKIIIIKIHKKGGNGVAITEEETTLDLKRVVEIKKKRVPTFQKTQETHKKESNLETQKREKMELE